MASCAFTFGRAKCFESPFQSETLRRLGQLEDFSRHHALRDEGGFFAQGEFGRIASFHEAREHCLEQGSARSEAFRKAVLDETGNGVVKTVRQGQGSAAFAARSAFTFADVLEKLLRGSCARRLGVGAGQKFPAVVVGATGEDLFPRLGVGRLEIMTVRQLLDLFGRQAGEKFPGQHAEEGVAQAIDAFEMLEEENQPFEVRGFELAVDAVERVRDRMADRRFLEITLQVEDVVAQSRDLGMLRFGNSPDEQMKFTRIMRKIGRNFFADKSMI